MNVEYDSFEDKEKAFGNQNVKQVDSIENFNRLKESLKNGNKIYRGVNEAKYKLFTSLQRQFLSSKINRNQYQTMFDFMNEEIKQLKSGSVLQTYYKELGTPISDYLYMSFLQHYGAPTTLLDFSEDIDTALYFATHDTAYKMSNVVPNHISNYVSLYWLATNEKESGLISIYDKCMKDCIAGIWQSLESHEKFSIQRLRSQIGDFLSFPYLQKTNLGIIHGNNDMRYKRQFVSSEQYYYKLYLEISRFLKTKSRSANDTWQNSIRFLFKQAVVIANLNQVAQHGCFIHYMPDDIYTPLEDYSSLHDGTSLNIHCVNIHKSLCPVIRSTLNVNQNALFPKPKTISKEAYDKTVSLQY